MSLSRFACAVLLGTASATRQCGDTTTYCPDSAICCNANYSDTSFGCRLAGGMPFEQPHAIRSSDWGIPEWPPSPTQSCCMPGPKLEPSTTLPNCMVLGDSVSIGYTGVAAKLLADVCQLQHAPWDERDGGAGSTSVGVACLDNFLVTQRQTPVKWDVILYNFGLHDLDNSSTAEAKYRTELTNITARLVATGAKLIYATTTPFMPDTTKGNHVVDDLNQIAREVIAGKGIQLLDLHKLVTDHCGMVYEDCDWCRRTPCSYHYNPTGETAQGQAVAAAFRPLVEPALVEEPRV
jgi:hypothetical protein